MIRLPDYKVESNCEQLSKLRKGEAFDEDGGMGLGGKRLIAGSSAEGLAMEKKWGHPDADADNMWLCGGLLGVHVPHGSQPPGRAVLKYRPEGCPPAYCKIEVTDAQILMVAEVNDVGRLDAGCVYRSKGVNWLHIGKTLKQLHLHGGFEISGPAIQSSGGMYEHIPALVCSAVHPDMAWEYVHRPRQGWPSPQQLELIKQLPILLVLIGHKHSDEFPLQARISWSHSEMTLIIDLPLNMKQVYIALKYAFKCLMKTFRGSSVAGDGRSLVGSYHLKTVFLRHLERAPNTMIRSQLDLMSGILYDFDGYLNAGNLPQYFLPDCNLLATVKPEERHIARYVIKHMLTDPLCAILTCPTRPKDIYGEVLRDELVAAFHQVSSLSPPMCARSREDLLWLLGRLDERRQQRYQKQREWDGRRMWVKISGRPELTGLVDMLQKHIGSTTDFALAK